MKLKVDCVIFSSKCFERRFLNNFFITMLIMPKILLLFSHQLTKEQLEDLSENYLIEDNSMIRLPKKLEDQWKQIPPDEDLIISTYLEPFIYWLKKESNAGDLILIQGEPGAVFYMINIAFQCELTPIYATTRRIFQEEKLSDGTIKKTSLFQHIAFRKYECLNK